VGYNLYVRIRIESRALRVVAARLIKFGFLGLFALGIQVALFWLLHSMIGLQPLLSGALANIVSIFVNFLLNSRFTWGDRTGPGAGRFFVRMGKYYVVIALGYFVYLSSFALLLKAGTSPTIGNLISVFAAGAFNFTLHSFWTFRAEDEPQDTRSQAK
jgi:putative flippase GtrA